MIKHIFKDGTTVSDIKDVYVPKKYSEEVTDVANKCEEVNKVEGTEGKIPDR